MLLLFVIDVTFSSHFFKGNSGFGHFMFTTAVQTIMTNLSPLFIAGLLCIKKQKYNTVRYQTETDSLKEAFKAS